MRQRLGLAAAVLSRPRLLVLDEPANGLDPVGQRLVHGVLRDLAASGAAVVFSSHRMDDVAAVCADVTLMAAGRVVFTGPLAELERENAVLDYRLVASDRSTALLIAASTPGVALLDGTGWPASAEVLVRAAAPALEQLQVRLVEHGVTLRELAPVVPALEAAFLKLTDRESGPS
jgi:ABC-2 type transport system ATP-binding protein